MWYEDDSPHLVLVVSDFPGGTSENNTSGTGKTGENVSIFIYGRKVDMDKTVGNFYQK